MDGVCKLGDFGLVVNMREVNGLFIFLRKSSLDHFYFIQNLFDAVEGDSKYLAPEVLSGYFSKKADIFSLGITLLELACDLDLPANGTLWHELRQGPLPPSVTRRKFTVIISFYLKNVLINHFLLDRFIKGFEECDGNDDEP